MWTSHLLTIYDSARCRAKRAAPFHWSLVAWCLVTVLAANPAGAQKVHVIRLEAEPDGEIYRFVPARVTARAGDVLRFKVSSGAPHNVTFEGDRLSAAAHDALNAAMPNRTGDLSGPILDRVGAEYRLVVPVLAPGTYGFFCTPHRVYDMRGELIVER